MRFVSMLTCLGMVVTGGLVRGDTICGEYLEVRNASVWAGECVVNSEVGIAGNRATLAWKIEQGSCDQVSLDGLAVVAIVFGDRTFGIGDKVTTRTILIVDQKADSEQHEALVGLARELAGDTIQQVIEVKRAEIDLEITGGGIAFLDAGPVTVKTRRLFAVDNVCGTKRERMAYPPLAVVSDEEPAFTLEHAYSGRADGLKSFTECEVASAVLAQFALD